MRLAPIFLALCLQGHAQGPWTDNFVNRLEAQALLQSLNTELLSNTSATLTLEKWSRDHKLAADPKLVANLVPGVQKPATIEQRQHLQVSEGERINYRYVQLRCGTAVLSEADNWYVPSRLTPEMNRLLETTDTPFGKAVLPLAPVRQSLGITILWRPLAEGWESRSAPAATPALLDIPAALFEHRAVLYDRDRRPFSEVREVYQRQLLNFPHPARR